MPADTSPDSKCPICLGRFDNIAYLDNCWHRFCFRCVQDRSKTKAECPLCKLPFISIFHTIRADDDFQEYKVTPSEEAASSSLEGNTMTFTQSPLNLHIYDLLDNYYYLTPPHDEGSGSDTRVTVDSLRSSVPGVGQSPWDDETPGPSYSTLEKYGATTGSLQELLASSDKGSAWKRIRLQPQLQADVDSSDGDLSSEYCDSTGDANLCAEGTPELTEQFSDSEECIKKERKYVKEEQSTQTPSRKRKSGSVQASPQNSNSSHGHGPCKKRHSEHLLKKRCLRSGDGSKHQSKSRRSRPHGTSHSLKSQSHEHTATRDSSQRKSSSEDNDHHYRRGCDCSGCKCDYPSCSQKTARDGPSCRKRTHSKAHCSKKPACPEFSIQPCTETTGLHSQIGLHERQDSYEQCKSRSPSRETKRTSNEKPGGKRKCKTRHLENAEEKSSMERQMERKYILERVFSIFSDYYAYKGSLSDSE